jgi:signal transduction histidine kinase
MSLHELSAGNDTPEAERARQNGTLHGHWLLLARCVGAVLTVFLLAFFIANLPVYFAQLQTVCVQVVCAQWQLTASNARAIQNAGLSITLYAIFTLALNLLSALVWFAVGGFIGWRKSDDWSALLTSLLLVLQGVLELCGFLSNGGLSIPLAYSSPAWYVPTVSLFLLDVVLIILVFSLFPNGRFAPGWMRWLVPSEVALIVIFLFLYTSSLQSKTVLIPLLTAVLWIFIVVSIIGGQMYRYRRVSSPTERQQTKWIVLGTIGEFVLGLLYLFPLLLFPGLRTPGSLYFLLVKPLIFLLALFGPLCFGVAILRYRLWDIDIIIQRTLVYAALSACVIGLYVLVVVGLGSLLQANILLSLLATGLIAILFQPLRQRLQQAINRLLYGERDDPYAALARLSRRLEATLVPETVLPTIVETVAQTFKLPYVAIALLPEQRSLTAPAARKAGCMTEAEAEAPDIVASYGAPTSDHVRVPLVYQSETIGYLLLAARAGETFGKTDASLLADLARQAGVAVYAVRLTASLKQLSTSLQQTRERLVMTREEERRRLRRDMHDGLGPTLASLTFKVDAARNLLRRDSERTDTLLAEVCREFLGVAQWQAGTLGVGEQSTGGWLVRDQCAYLLRVLDGQIEPNKSAATAAEYIRRFGAKLGEQAVRIVTVRLDALLFLRVVERTA